MAYILTRELHDDERGGYAAFERYQRYIASVREALPPGAYALASADWYFDSRDHRSPHDARLEGVEISEEADPEEPGRRTLGIRIRLLGAYQDGRIELRYRDVQRYTAMLSPERRDRGYGHRDWRYDEFRLAPGDRVEHEIEWWGVGETGRWLIEAADVEYAWIPLAGATATVGDA